MVSFEQALRYPTTSDHWLRNIAVGGILTYLSVFVLPLIFVYGYGIRVISSSSKGRRTPPQWSDWMRLFIDGVQAWVIGFIYILVPVLVGVVTIGSAVLALATGGEMGAAASAGTIVVGGFLTVVLTVLFGYIGAAGLVNFARHRSFLAAFDTSVIVPVISDRAFGIAYLSTILVLIVVAVIGAIPLIGWIISPFAAFYGLLVVGHLLADGFATAIERSGIPVKSAPPVAPSDSTD